MSTAALGVRRRPIRPGQRRGSCCTSSAGRSCRQLTVSRWSRAPSSPSWASSCTSRSAAPRRTPATRPPSGPRHTRRSAEVTIPMLGIPRHARRTAPEAVASTARGARATPAWPPPASRLSHRARRSPRCRGSAASIPPLTLKMPARPAGRDESCSYERGPWSGRCSLPRRVELHRFLVLVFQRRLALARQHRQKLMSMIWALARAHAC
mmetsp:Transcript_43/g.143  ORF Transcript_43/g.143 Transcript_43/m.143 type:complete len:209 (+) Transcript_43:312-938(+)